MRILKKYKDENDWNETSLEECLDHTENSGYWKPETVKEMLKSGQIVFTPNAEYKMIIQEKIKGEINNETIHTTDNIGNGSARQVKS